MSFDAYLLISLFGATLLLISMQPLAWVLWGVLNVVAVFRFFGLVLRLLSVL
jgi:hypothetical protein